MTEQYTKNYHILGIQRGASWKQLRQAYKSLVNTWHPDRFQQDNRKRKLAEEKTKEITQSYKELAEYYKQFGVLPLAPNTARTSSADFVPQNVPEAHPAPENLHTKPAADFVKPVQIQKSWQSTLAARVFAATAVAGIAYYIWQLDPSEHDDKPPAIEEHANQPTGVQNNENSNHEIPTDKQFTTGSSLGEVYTIQGVPTKTDNDIWYYGKSKIYFFKGKVLRWDENSENPLRIRITPGTDRPDSKFFGKGSSKEEVLTAQGTPDRDAGSVWDYGVSRVYFENDRVTGWHETPLNPLRVRR